MKVFMLIKKMRYSGAYKMFAWLAKSLMQQGFDVVVCTYLENECDILPKDVKLIQLKTSSGNWIKRLKMVRTAIREENADVSISFLLDANILNLLACWRIKTKSIVCERNDPFKPYYFKLKVLKPLFRLAGGAVFQLPKVATYYKNIKAPTAIIPNPVVKLESKNVKSFALRENVIVSLGRLDFFQKRQDVLIRAFAIFCKDNPDYVLRIYGDGPAASKLKRLAVTLGVAERVDFAGVSDNPQLAISNAKMFVLTSDFEGIPNALIEAMSIGLPCIATDCSPGGAALLIVNEKNGLLVPKGDFESVAKCMKRIVDDPDYADFIGRNAKEIVETFSESCIIDKWTSYIKQLTE